MLNSIIKFSATLLTSMSLSNQIKTYAIKNSFNINDSITPFPINHKISIVMPSYNEEPFIEYAAQSILAQNIITKYPDQFELVVADSKSKDNTVEIAERYADKVIISPKGKITTRNYVLNEIDGDIIVSIDADCYYPPNFLNQILKPFDGVEVVGVSGFTVDNLPYGYVINSLYPLAHLVDNYSLHLNRLYGRCSAYYTNLQRLEPFDESIDQMSVGQMVQEEEIKFGKKLAKYGTILFNPKACCFHFGSVKEGCRENMNYSDTVDNMYCEQIKNKERF